MNEIQIFLTAEKTEFLDKLLTTTLKDMRVEEHRTRTPTYREFVLKQEDLAKSVADKMRNALALAPTNP